MWWMWQTVFENTYTRNHDRYSLLCPHNLYPDNFYYLDNNFIFEQIRDSRKFGSTAIEINFQYFDKWKIWDFISSRFLSNV